MGAALIIAAIGMPIVFLLTIFAAISIHSWLSALVYVPVVVAALALLYFGLFKLVPYLPSPVVVKNVRRERLILVAAILVIVMLEYARVAR
jgi:hypothetical protein